MSDNVIIFDKEKALAAIANSKKAYRIPDLIGSLQTEVEAAMQAYGSWELIENGYCGSGLKREIEQARSLPERLKRAGTIMQQILMEAT